MDSKKSSDDSKNNNQELKGAPELNKSRTTPQLIRSTKSTKVIPVTPEDPVPWFIPDETDNTTVLASGPQDNGQEDGALPPSHPPSSDAQIGNLQPDRWEQTQTLRPAPSHKKPKKAKKRHPFLKFLLLVILLAAATVGAYWFGGHAADKDKNTGIVQSTVPQTSATTTDSTGKTTIKHYDSTNFSLGFDYPSDWKVTDTAARLTLASPAMRLPVAKNDTKLARVVLTVQPKQTSLADYPTGAGLAALASDKLTYSKPSLGQRSSTYLSFLSYQSQNSDGLDAIFVTGDNGYQKGQSVPQADIIKADPLINATFQICDNSCTDNSNTVTLDAQKWNGAAAQKTLDAILESIRLL